MKKTCACIGILLLMYVTVFSQPAQKDTSGVDIKSMAQNIVKGEKNNYHKAKKLLDWLSTHFTWMSTDYQNRTVKQIISRKGGNCFEMAVVYMAMINELHIKYRPIAEINLHVTSDQRELDAEKRIKSTGFKASVFGRQHNDHRWVEVYDDDEHEWIPVDPTMDLIGIDQWEKGRAWFGERRTLNPEFNHDMIAPIAIFVADSLDKSHMLEDRTQYYMVTGLDNLYHHQLQKLKGWTSWATQLKQFDPHAKLAFSGKENLHDYESEISQLLNTYNELRRAAPKSPLKQAKRHDK